MHEMYGEDYSLDEQVSDGGSLVIMVREVRRRWPLAEPGPIEQRCVVLTGETATRAQEIGESRPITTLWRHDDVTFHAWSRPLLPDEEDCRATELRYWR